MRFATIVVTVAMAASIALGGAKETAPNTTEPEFFLIRHAEKKLNGAISAKGRRRAQCLVKIFGKDSKYNIQHIMVQRPYPHSRSSPCVSRRRRLVCPCPANTLPDKLSQRPYNTTLPLANALGIEIDTPCNYNHPKCAADFALKYRGGNVLIGWEHGYLSRVSKALGGKHVKRYPREWTTRLAFGFCLLAVMLIIVVLRFDLIYNQPPPYTNVTVTKEDCEGLDK
ncbi:uncharacterized protein MAM_00433 [Metarhizium album ARSEF 1941]|uniref:Phosphoglycerate mutase family protein n=1 Tax=Metarhizium album (strain ARSEF 1941) TaxID=1081103 RepID=A0A0B2WYS6_METAS|nr:uncharacterized protein MAM_00433 [Metarhizium album ARSEF 1941]KHO01432.1 hypothetical protein MAM_00433 [Metarhizium album ARSEF 1941]